MTKSASFSTLLDPSVKKAVVLHCKQKGLKIRTFAEQAFVEHLEDEIDIQAYYERKNEETVPFSEILKQIYKK